MTRRAAHSPVQNTKLLDAAKSAASAAYSPYSHFSVGAALRTGRGKIYFGVNVENTSYPVGTCAERNAIGAAVLAEGPRMEIMEIAVAAVSHGVDTPCAPCGACRQAIYELGRNSTVIYRGKGLIVKRNDISILLPFAFEQTLG